MHLKKPHSPHWLSKLSEVYIAGVVVNLMNTTELPLCLMHPLVKLEQIVPRRSSIFLQSNCVLILCSCETVAQLKGSSGFLPQECGWTSSMCVVGPKWKPDGDCMHKPKSKVHISRLRQTVCQFTHLIYILDFWSWTLVHPHSLCRLAYGP